MIFHKLCKEDIACAIKRKWEAEQKIANQEEIIEEQKEIITDKEKLLATATCGDLLFNHKSVKYLNLQTSNKSSSKIDTIKKPRTLYFSIFKK